jgi:DNA-binding SARP family transcriptional activator
VRDPVKSQVHEPVTFSLLGPFQVRLEDRAIPIKATKQRALLAALVLHANRPVTVEELTDLLWDDRSPPGARGTVQAYVMRLRSVLGSTGRRVLRTVAGGYQLCVPAEAVDLARFERLTGQAERSAAAGQLATASHELGQALALWRGPPLADIDSEALRRTEVPRLEEQRMLATERRIELDLALGRHRQVIAEMRELVSRYPLRERYWYLLMQALHRSGWRADALASYRSARDVITRELGVEPGEALRELHQVILHGGHDDEVPEAAGRYGLAKDAVVPDGVAGPGVAGAAWAGQCQLPREIPDFVGRSAETAEIAAALTSRVSVPVVVLSGPPGAGKTALAVRVAHRVRSEFPDGQFYVPLTTNSGPRSPGQVLASLLAATGIPASAIPREPSALSAAFRARLADRRVLLVLDCAREGYQVRPLLPGTPGCAVLVTSHSELRSLCALAGARRHALAPLPAAQSRHLLGLLIGEQRVAREPAAADRVAALCGHLPLALRIAAATLACRPGQPLRDYAAELDGGTLLDKLALDGDRAAAVRTAFGRCCDALDPGLRRCFAALAALSARSASDFTVRDAAAKLGLPADEAAARLDALAERGLLLPAVPGRYRFVSPLRTFAAELAPQL